MSEEPTLLRLTKRWAGSELVDAADVVQKRCGEQEIVSEARVKLRRSVTAMKVRSRSVGTLIITRPRRSSLLQL